MDEGTFHYHVTTESRLKAIRREGLRTGRRAQWRDRSGRPQGDRGAIFVISDFGQAARWALKMEWDHGLKGKIRILKLRGVGELAPDDHWQSGLYGHTWFKTRVPVPAEAIVAVYEITPEMTRQVVADGTADEPADASSETPRP